MDASQILDKILGLDKEIMKLQDDFDNQPEGPKKTALMELAANLLKNTGESDSVPLPLIRVAEMICALEDGPAQLAVGLSHANEDVRHLFGEALISLGTEDGVESIIPAVDYAIEAGDSAALEMPFILAWVDDPASTMQIHRFLDSNDVNVVYAAIEACASASDMDSVEALKGLVDDTREIEVEDDEDNDEVITIGMLAKEAIEIIESSGE